MPFTQASMLRLGIGCLTIFFAVLTTSGQAKLTPKAGMVQTNGLTLAYESLGNPKAETILLIAGTNSQLTMWPVELCRQLVKNGYRVIRFDNRDVGLSTKFDQAGMPDWAAITKALQERTTPPLAYTLDDMAADAVGLLKALNISKAHIVGASMGGMIAQRVAYNHPEYVLSLVSIMSGGGSPVFPMVANPEVMSQIPQPGSGSDTVAYIHREIEVMKSASGKVYPRQEAKIRAVVEANVRRSYYPDGLHRQGAASTAGFYAGRQNQLKTIAVPTLVIHGSDDPLVVVDAGREVATLIPNAQFELLKGMGHDLPDALLTQIATLIVRNAAKAKPSPSKQD